MFLGDGDKMICLVCEELWGIKAQIKALHAGLFFFLFFSLPYTAEV